MISLRSKARPDPDPSLGNRAWPRVRPRSEKIIGRDGPDDIAAGFREILL